MRGMLLGIALVLGVATQASAANWVVVTTGPEGNTISVDSETLQRNGDTLHYWGKVAFVKEQKDGTSYTIGKMVMNCSTQEITYGAAHDYNRAGTVLRSSPPSIVEPQDIIPGSSGSLMAKVLCSLPANWKGHSE